MNENSKGFRIIFGKESENFSVQFDIFLFELMNEFTISDFTLGEWSESKGGVYFYIPKAPEVSFLFSAIMEGMSIRVEQCLSGKAFF